MGFLPLYHKGVKIRNKKWISSFSLLFRSSNLCACLKWPSPSSPERISRLGSHLLCWKPSLVALVSLLETRVLKIIGGMEAFWEIEKVLPLEFCGQEHYSLWKMFKFQVMVPQHFFMAFNYGWLTISDAYSFCPLNPSFLSCLTSF